MEVKLTVVGGKHAGQQITVPGPKFFIGRAEDCHLRPNSDLVSRHHAVILVEEGFVAVRDFGSKNGTFVNGERLVAERELKNNDQLKIGALEFEIHLSVDVGGKKKPKVQSIEEAAARTVQSAGDDDLDVSDWLEEPDDDLQNTRAAGTEAAETSPTAATSASETTEIPDIGLARPRKKKEKPAEEESNVVGRFKGMEKPTSESSKSAADDVLQKFFNRKP